MNAEQNDKRDPPSYGQYLSMCVLADSSLTRVLDRAEAEMRLIAAEIKVWRSQGLVDVYDDQGRLLGVPASWRPLRDRALLELGGPS